MPRHLTALVLLAALFSSSEQTLLADEVGSDPLASLCPAADRMRVEFPGFMNEAELAYYSEYSCATLERFLLGEALFVQEPQPEPGLTTGAGVEGAYEAMLLLREEEQTQRPPRGLPCAEGNGNGPQPPHAQFLWSEEEAATDIDSIPAVVIPAAPFPLAPADLLRMQEVYLAMGCALKPESLKCRDSSYADLLMAELGDPDAW